MLPTGPNGGKSWTGLTTTPDQLATETLVTLGPIVPAKSWPEKPGDVRMSLAPESI